MVLREHQGVVTVAREHQATSTFRLAGSRTPRRNALPGQPDSAIQLRRDSGTVGRPHSTTAHQPRSITPLRRNITVLLPSTTRPPAAAATASAVAAVCRIALAVVAATAVVVAATADGNEIAVY